MDSYLDAVYYLVDKFLAVHCLFFVGNDSRFFCNFFVYWIADHRLCLAITGGLCIPLVRICWMAKYYWHKSYLLEYCMLPLKFVFVYVIDRGVISSC